MDVATLRRTSAAMQDLIDMRNTRLIEALEERNWLKSEIRMKNTFVKMLVQQTNQKPVAQGKGGKGGKSGKAGGGASAAAPAPSKKPQNLLTSTLGGLSQWSPFRSKKGPSPPQRVGATKFMFGRSTSSPPAPDGASTPRPDRPPAMSLT